MKRLLSVGFTLVCLCSSLTLLAQDRVVTGKVTDSKDQSPVVGASVQPKGSTTGTSTATDGTFRVSIPSGINVLIISSAEFESQEVDITGKSTLDVALAPKAAGLTEVVVIGYGTQRKKDVTGSVVTIAAKDFNQGPTTSPQQLIQGKVPGLEVTNTSGMPGAATTIRIRGNSTIRSGNNPLYVVDGVPLDGRIARPALNSPGLGNSPAADPLYFFNSNDISTISILKDASASAIYGSRASNGVVLIETKRAAAGDVKVDVSSSIGIANIVKKYEVLDASEYRSALKARNITTGDYGADVDPLDAVLQTAIVNNQNISLSAGTENAKYRASLGYYSQEGIVKNSQLKRYSGLLNGQYKLLPSRRLSMSFMVLASHNTEDAAAVTNDAGASGNLISAALQWNPTLALRQPDGSQWSDDNPTGATQPNPLDLLDQYRDRTNVEGVLAYIQAGYKFTDWLEYNFRVGLNQQSGERRASLSNTTVFTEVINRGAAAIVHARLTSKVVQHTLTFNKALSDAFNLNAILGYEYQSFQYKTSFMSGTGFSTAPIVDYTNILQNLQAANTSVGSFQDPSSYLQSFFGRAIGNFKDKFIVTATVRADGSSKFGENNRYGYFPSFAAAWNIDNEEFFKDMSTFSQLKLRAGWGITGNQEFPSGASQFQYGYSSGAISLQNVSNPDLKWEETKQWNIGIDYALFNNRLYGSLDYFNKNTSNLLFNLEAIQPAPATKYWKNLPGEIINNGFEFLVNGVLVSNRKLTWSASINGAFIKNEVQNYDGPPVLTGGLNAQGSSGARVQRLASGQPLNAFYTRKFTGFDQSGFATYADNGNTFYFVGDPNPDFVGGFSTAVDFGKWNVGINFSSALGHLIYNETLNGVLNLGNLGKWNIDKNLVGNGEATANPITSSSRFLEKASYVKLNNATIRYSVGNLGAVIRNLTISLVGQNLFYITKFSGFSPEVNTDKQVDGVSSYGMEYIPYPSARTIQLGVNFSL